MNRTRLLLTATFSLLFFWGIPTLSQAAMDCLGCHDLHGAAGGTLNTAADKDLICDTCHGPAGTAIYADRHVDPNARYQNDPTGSVDPAWEIPCMGCHSLHSSDVVNHLYNGGATHTHDLGSDTGNSVSGVNIKLMGRDEDGTGVAKVSLPLKILSVTSSPNCSNSNTDVQISYPTFGSGDGPLHSIMVGDRIAVVNSNDEFNGVFRVKETAWDNFLATGGSGWVCFDRPNAATYSGSGYIHSRGWHTRPKVVSGSWSGGTAILQLQGDFPIREGDTVHVTGITSDGAGDLNGLHAVTAVTQTRVSGASWSGGVATLTLEDAHLYQTDDPIVVEEVISGGAAEFNGKYTVTATTATTVSYALASDPGSYTNHGFVTRQEGRTEIAYALVTDPGTITDASGSKVEWVGSTKAVQDMEVVTPAGPPPYTVTDATWTAGARKNDPDVAELTLDRAHPFATDDVVTVTGIDPSGYNGTWTLIGTTATTVQYEIDTTDPGTYVSGGEIPDPATPESELQITLANSDASIQAFQAATPSVRDGDILLVYGASPDEYNGRWEVQSVALPVISVRCPPYSRSALQLPACTLAGFSAYVSGGEVQSTGSMRPVVFESRGTDNTMPGVPSDYTHSFANTDVDEDGWMDGPCETCHTETSKQLNDGFGSGHNDGRTCTECHSHSVGFDKSNDFCPAGRTCPPTN